MYNAIGAGVLHSLIQQSIRNAEHNNTKKVSFEKSTKEKYDVCFPVSDLSTVFFRNS